MIHADEAVERLRVPYTQACTFVCTSSGVALDSPEVRFTATGRECVYCGSIVCYAKYWPRTPEQGG